MQVIFFYNFGIIKLVNPGVNQNLKKELEKREAFKAEIEEYKKKMEEIQSGMALELLVNIEAGHEKKEAIAITEEKPLAKDVETSRYSPDNEIDLFNRIDKIPEDKEKPFDFSNLIN